jgi:hypothetical protein
MLNSGDKRLAAISAWKDIMPEHVNDPFVHNKVFEALFNPSAPLSYATYDTDTKKARNFLYQDQLAHGVPSQFESDGRRNSFGHLIDVLKSSEEFTDSSHEDIADMLFKPYVVYDGGAHMSNVFLAKDLKRLNIDQEDLYDSANYPMIRAMKEGKNLAFTIEGEEGFQGIERLKILKADLMKRDADASIWTATQPSQDGESLEVVLMTGDMDDRNDRHVVARWHYIEKDENGKDILKRLQYNGVDEQLKVLSAYKRGNFMDIDNDDDIYDQVARWIEEGPSGVLDSIPGGFEEVVTAKYQPFNIGKFEYEQVVEPFWKKYGPEGKNLSKMAFAAKWEEVRHAETYTFEEKFFDISFNGILDLYRPSIGSMRYGVRQTKVRGYDARRRNRNKPTNIMQRNSADQAKQLSDFRKYGY